MTKIPDEVLDKVTRAAMDKGLIIEAGWLGMKAMSIPPNAPQHQIDDMRMAFYGGAQHLFASIMSALDPGKDPTEDDLRRMEMISSELDEFIKQYKAKHGV